MINALYRFFSVPYTTNVQIAPLLYLLVPVKKAVVEPENKGEFCKLHTRETPENVKTDDKCISKYKYRLTSCGGNCDSSSVAVTGESLYDANCKCCQPAVYQTIDIPVICEGNLEQIAKFTNITMCKCQTFECQAGPSHNKQVQINGQGAVVDNNVQQKKRRRRALSRLFALPP